MERSKVDFLELIYADFLLVMDEFYQRTCRKLDKMAMKIPFWSMADQCEVMLPITGRHAEKATPKFAFQNPVKLPKINSDYLEASESPACSGSPCSCSQAAA